MVHITGHVSGNKTEGQLHDLTSESSRSPNRTSYLNFSHISVVTFGLSSISKNLRRKRTSVRLSSGEKTHLSHLILAIAATTSGLHRSFARTFMVEEEEDAVVLRDVKMRIGGAVEQWSSGK